jgi:membrane protease YdiL (CAAX protease family)
MWILLAVSLVVFSVPRWRSLAYPAMAVVLLLASWQGVLLPVAWLWIVPLVLLVAWIYRQQGRPCSPMIELLLLAVALALFLHRVPGVDNLLVLDKVHAGEHSTPFTLYYSLDKASLPFVLLALMPSLFSREPKTVTAKYWLLLFLTIPLLLVVACAVGGLKWEPHFPLWLGRFLLSNLFFVALAEEALFRGYLQQRLEQWFGVWPALLITSLLFGLAHGAGGMLLVIFASLAGVIYGLAWLWSGRLWVAALCHLLLNVCHLLLFTYPAAQC